jgi:hypothetical protein
MEQALDALQEYIDKSIATVDARQQALIAIAALQEVIKNQGEHQAEIVQDENGYLTTQGAVSYIPNVGDKLYTSTPTIPEGWQLVPIEPTEEMLDEIAGAKWNLLSPTKQANEIAAYKAMLSASPKYKGD